MTDKMKLPPAVVWETTGELPPIEINWLHIMQVCHGGLQNKQKYVILPVEESQDYKPQRRRLVTDDKSSPRGLIQRDQKALHSYYPYAAARFDINELAEYAAKRFNEATQEELERMGDQIADGIQQ